jgi:(E)-4-hydroxy-3-methylbut-2-enyl-diphosphate synthase
LGDTIRVSLTEDPELEIPVCKDLAKRYASREQGVGSRESIPAVEKISYDPFSYERRESFVIDNMGGKHVPVVIADLSKIEKITRAHLKSTGYIYDIEADKWNISDAAAYYIFTGHQQLDFELPATV